MTLLRLVEQIRRQLQVSAYPNEAAISHSIVVPILRELGWDNADPGQLWPEYSTGNGRADFALIGLGRRPAVFIEVKAIGRAADADRQLFAYAYEEGVPLCVLTDGREWSFYLPADQGTREERRVYLLQLDDREPADSAEVLTRYLARERVRSGSALDDARNEHRAAARQREATAGIPAAWAELVRNPEDSLIELVADKTETLIGFRPEPRAVIAHLRSLRPSTEPVSAMPAKAARSIETTAPQTSAEQLIAPSPSQAAFAPPSDDLAVEFTLFGQHYCSPTANHAMSKILAVLAARDPARLPALADEVRTPTYNYIANRLQDIAPHAPPLSKGLEFAAGWFVGTHMSNKRKTGIIRAAARVYQLSSADLEIALRNG